MIGLRYSNWVNYVTSPFLFLIRLQKSIGSKNASFLHALEIQIGANHKLNYKPLKKLKKTALTFDW